MQMSVLEKIAVVLTGRGYKVKEHRTGIRISSIYGKFGSRDCRFIDDLLERYDLHKAVYGEIGVFKTGGRRRQSRKKPSWEQPASAITKCVA